MTEAEKYMQEALLLAQEAARNDEVPVGAVIVRDGQIIARAANTRNANRMPTAHAEIAAIEQACALIGDWRLNGCDLYVTLEPCMMCLGACYNARLDKVCFGAYDSHGGITQRLEGLNTLNHNLQVEGGVLREQCAALLADYFSAKRK